MTWIFQHCQFGSYRLQVTGLRTYWRYEIWWATETALTKIGTGSETYPDVYDARHAAVLHLSNILPKAQAKRLLASQGELVWESPFKRRKGH